MLDMDSSVSPTFGAQEGPAYNGHFGCTCYHPLFVFNQFGDLGRCALRPGNVHSAHGWRDVLVPVVERYKERAIRLYLRGDAAFASPEIYDYLEAEGMLYAIRLPANKVLQESIAHLLKRPVGRPPKEVRRYHASFSYQAGTWDKPRRVVAKVEWQPGELYPRVGFVVTNQGRPAERVVAFYNQRGTAEQWIKEGKNAIRWTRLSCRRFDHNAVRLQLHALAYNLGNFMRTLALPDAVEQWSLTSLREKLIKIGAKIVRHGRYVTFQMAEVVIPRELFADILRRIDRPKPPPAPARATAPRSFASPPTGSVRPDRRQEYHSAPPTPPIDPQSSGSARRWPSFEGVLHVKRLRGTLSVLGGSHMGNPGLRCGGLDLALGIPSPHRATLMGQESDSSTR